MSVIQFAIESCFVIFGFLQAAIILLNINCPVRIKRRLYRTSNFGIALSWGVSNLLNNRSIANYILVVFFVSVGIFFNMKTARFCSSCGTLVAPWNKTCQECGTEYVDGRREKK